MSTVPGRSADGSAGDRYALWDAAYVLGALSPAERREFEDHLAGCPACRAAVSEVAAMPGLLAQVGPDEVAAEADADGPPPRVLSEVVAAGRRRHRVQRVLIGAVAAVLLLAAGFGLGRISPIGVEEPSQRLLAFAEVEPSDITAVVSLVSEPGGTQVDVECQYGSDHAPAPGSEYARYTIVLTDRAGRTDQVKDWPVSTNKVMTPSGWTSWALSDIERVEIREEATGEPVLRAEVR